MTPDQQRQVRQENARRRGLGLPELDDQGARDWIQEGQNTAQRQENLNQIGSIITDKRGKRVGDGPYKGMHPNAARQAAITGRAIPTGKSGYVRGGPISGTSPWENGTFEPRATGGPAPMFSGTTAAPMQGEPTAQKQVAQDAAETAAKKTAQGMAAAVSDAKQGITSRGPDYTTTAGGGIITGQRGDTTRAIASPNGTGSVTMLPAGQKATDPRLAAEIAATKARQAQGVFTPERAIPTPAQVAAATPAPVTPATPAASPPTVTGNGMVDPMLLESRGFTAGTTLPNRSDAQRIIAAAPPATAPVAPPAIPRAPAPQADMSAAGMADYQAFRSATAAMSPPPAAATAPAPAAAPVPAQAQAPARGFFSQIKDFVMGSPSLSEGVQGAGNPASAIAWAQRGAQREAFLTGKLSAPSAVNRPSPPQPQPIAQATAQAPEWGGARAAGGPVQPGKAYLVGEQGPEIIVPPSAGMVIPNNLLPPAIRRPGTPQPRPSRTPLQRAIAAAR